jgi:hypothetical protein
MQEPRLLALSAGTMGLRAALSKNRVGPWNWTKLEREFQSVISTSDHLAKVTLQFWEFACETGADCRSCDAR